MKVDSRLSFHQLNDTLFVRYMAGARAYATTAGFESVCEAMYLGKPVLMVPTHIEQACNAFDAVHAGAAPSLGKEGGFLFGIQRDDLGPGLIGQCDLASRNEGGEGAVEGIKKTELSPDKKAELKDFFSVYK